MGTAATEDVHVFENGIKVFRSHLIPLQVERYASGVNLHEPEEERYFNGLLGEVRPAGVFFDVGAAIGYYSILAMRQRTGLAVHAFEPLDVHRSRMADNLRLNGLAPDCVRVHREAIGAARGIAEFEVQHFASVLKPGRVGYGRYLADRLRRLTGRIFGRPTEPAAGVVPVAVTTIDAAAARHSEVDLIKVDVQGFEIDVLKGAAGAMAARKVRRWLIGTHGDQIHRDCVAILRGHGYRIEYDSPVVAGQPDGMIIAKAA